MFTSATWLAKPRHRQRRYLNRKFKGRDRGHGKSRRFAYFGKDRILNRRKSHSETGYGVGWEKNPNRAL